MKITIDIPEPALTVTGFHRRVRASRFVRAVADEIEAIPDLTGTVSLMARPRAANAAEALHAAVWSVEE
jgi:hypothetical protein